MTESLFVKDHPVRHVRHGMGVVVADVGVTVATNIFSIDSANAYAASDWFSQFVLRNLEVSASSAAETCCPKILNLSAGGGWASWTMAFRCFANRMPQVWISGLSGEVQSPVLQRAQIFWSVFAAARPKPGGESKRNE